jgi:hypothetical protein
MLCCQGFTSSKIQEAENMGKKTVPIAVRIIPRRKGHKTTEGDIDA